MTLGACRAYFKLNDGGSASAVELNFDGDSDDNEATGITTTDLTDYTDKAGAWYTVNGVKLSGKPTQKGIYVNNGKKVVIK